MNIEKVNIAIIGQGYVGLPLAIEFGKKYPTLGFDINVGRIDELNKGVDHTNEATTDQLKSAKQLTFSANINDIKDCNIYIVTVPTPIDEFKTPNLNPLRGASKMLGDILKKGDTVIYESTVYPGCTEEVCVPLLEKSSGLTYNKDFFCGYSPERINPGDSKRTIEKIVKITSGSNKKTSNLVDKIYKKISKVGTYKTESIKVAEAAKVIENTQRDLNIALINELAIIFNKMSIDTEAVLKAAGTKWNFLNFRPGLVGGHCIGVDPYYLTHKAESIGYNPQIILAGRRQNDAMGAYVAAKFAELLSEKQIQAKNAKVLVMGLTFKENCPDLRNTKVIDLINELIDYSTTVKVYDPWVDLQKVKQEFSIDVFNDLPHDDFDIIINAVSHNEFRKIDFNSFKKKNTLIFDVKGSLGKISDASL